MHTLSGMTEQKGQKLKRVLNQVPPGFVVDSAWLNEHEVTRSSAHDYDRDRWLERVAQGVYRRPLPSSDADAFKDWRTPILSAQWLMSYDFHVGGTTALSLEGRDHYLGLSRRPQVYVYGDAPKWLSRLSVDAQFQFRRRQLFGRSRREAVDNADFDPSSPDAPNPWDWPLRISSPERAILEALNELPDQESFHTLDMIFQGLSNLRPGRLTSLLKACKSVKVKRLFFLFADRHHHRWLAHIDRSAIDLGTGPRALVENGRYSPEHQLMVPAEFVVPREENNSDGA
jgi:hypothetical protein